MKHIISSRKITLRYCLYQVAYYATCVGTSSFATTYLLEKDFSASQIGMILALTNILSCIVQPILGDVVDRLKKFILPQMIATFLAGSFSCFVPSAEIREGINFAEKSVSVRVSPQSGAHRRAEHTGAEGRADGHSVLEMHALSLGVFIQKGC